MMKLPQRSDCLVFLPTYNEAGTVRSLHAMIRVELPDADILFIDDASPDGTGEILEEMCTQDTRLSVMHRSNKQGIGSAHKDGIAWAYSNGYRLLITMDSDMAHSPEYLGTFVASSEQFLVVVGNRFQRQESIKDWNLWRRFLTRSGHMLTRFLLGMEYDATGAFRAYLLDQIPQRLFSLIHADDYAFFFESLQVLDLNGIPIGEVPIHLPSRTYGNSKMQFRDIFFGFRRLLVQAVRLRVRRQSMIYKESETAAIGYENNQISWDRYWRSKSDSGSRIYQVIAAFYRKFIIKPSLNKFLNRTFPAGATLLHAGCGSGHMDYEAIARFNVTALDISPVALDRYYALHGHRVDLVNGDLFQTPVDDGSFDGLFNLGVMEHFSDEELGRLLIEFRRVLKKNGRLVLFWPPEFGLSVRVLKAVHFLLNDVLKKNIHLHPKEPSLLKSRSEVEARLTQYGFDLDAFYFGSRDLFTHAIVIASRRD